MQLTQDQQIALIAAASWVAGCSSELSKETQPVMFMAVEQLQVVLTAIAADWNQKNVGKKG